MAVKWRDYSPKQREFAAAIFHRASKYICWLGSAGTGKSQAACYGLLRRADLQANAHYLVCGQSLPALQRNIAVQMIEICKDNKRQHQLFMTGDARLEVKSRYGTNYFHFFGGSNAGAWERIQGSNMHGALIDEVTLLDWSFIDTALTRSRQHKAIVIMNGNKTSPFGDFKRNIWDKADELGIYRMEADKSDIILPDDVIRDMELRLSGASRRRLLHNEFAVNEGLVYLEPHTFTDTIEVDDWRKAVVGMDWGPRGISAGVLAVPQGDKWYIIDEFRHDNRDVQLRDDALAALVKRRWPAFTGKMAVDPNAPTFYDALRDAGFDVVEADNDVLDGIEAVNKYLFTGELQISRKCEYLLGEMSSYHWHPTLDKPVKKDDHSVDALRYMVKTLIHKAADMTDVFLKLGLA